MSKKRNRKPAGEPLAAKSEEKTEPASAPAIDEFGVVEKRFVPLVVSAICLLAVLAFLAYVAFQLRF